MQLAGVAATAAATGATGLLSGCSSPKPTPGASGAGSVTVTHLFGQTVIKEPPKRVVSAGYTEQDDLLAVGVVPIAVTNWFGDQPFAVWPWAQPKLGAAQPVVLNLDNGIPVDQIASLKPDLIVAINAGVDADTYQKLSAIAPTVPQSGGDAFFEPWKDAGDHDRPGGIPGRPDEVTDRRRRQGVRRRCPEKPAVEGQEGVC